VLRVFQILSSPKNHPIHTSRLGGTTQCNGGPCVFTIANTALRIYSTSGAVIATRSLHQQFGLSPNYEINRSNSDCLTVGGPNCYGDSLTDPEVYYDPPSGRWFISVIDLETDHSTDDLTGNTTLLIAVSTASDPNGAYNIYTIHTTNDGSNGTPSHPLTGFAGNDFDGFTGYWPLSGQNRPRWGDYSGACTDANGDAWIIGGKANSDSVRTFLANWGSRVAKIDITP
jgi:hypothetical protein